MSDSLTETGSSGVTARLLEVIDVVPACILVVDARTHMILDVNIAGERFFRAPRSRIVGMICHHFVCPNDVGHCPVTDCGQTVDNSERLALTADGRSVPVLKTVSRAWIQGQDCLVESFLDISDRKRVELELTRSNQDLQSFAYAASHDLQEPARMVVAFLQLLERDFGPSLPEAARRHVAFALEGGVRMQQLVAGLLEYSLVEPQPPRKTLPVSAESALADALANLHPLLEEAGARIIAGPPPSVPLERAPLSRLFQNLIGNALKFRGERPLEIRVESLPEPGGWHLTVADNGIGIPQGFLEKIFLIFHRLHTRDRYSGAGIGLAVCKKIVERAGGRIWAESVPGEGSTFHFTLPAAGAE